MRRVGSDYRVSSGLQKDWGFLFMFAAHERTVSGADASLGRQGDA